MSFESFKKSCLKNLGIEVDYEDYKQYLKDISEEDEKKPKPETEAQKRRRLNKEYEPVLLARREKWNREHPEEVARREKRKNAIKNSSSSNKPRESNEIKTLARIAKYNKNDYEARKQSYEAAKLFLKKVCNDVLDKESFEKLKTKVLSKFKNKSFNEKLYREIKRTEFEDLDFSEKENGRYNDDVFQDIFPFIKFNPYHNQNHEKDVEDTLKYHGYFNY